LGTTFTIFDQGIANASECFGYAPPQTELGAVLYGTNLFGWEPREFSAVVPKKPRKMEHSNDTIANALERGDKADFWLISNRTPKWNEARNTYTLDFRGNVKKASKKNFILDIDDGSRIPLLLLL